MFTGIVEECGIVTAIEPSEKSIRLQLQAALAAQGAKIGDSLAVNGCCLTIVKIKRTKQKTLLEFDLLRETWRLTNLQFAQPGARVNLERSLAVDGRVHGHFVTGHIDGLAQVKTFEQRGADFFLEATVPKPLLKYIVHKGAIALDGISLTVASVTTKTLTAWIIPHTRAITTLQDRHPGDHLNIETDLLAKYAEKSLKF